ncbi:MAG: endonuclease/exonuclease/phosphatase family protein [Alistipes sp.]|nr:endonuclease/exonuclease/phosphatase family protein [Alistipes sp.]
MRAILTLILSLVAFGAVEAKRPTASVHRVMSCNIRITGLPADEVDGRRWDDRKEYMIEVIRRQRPDVVMMQEVIYDSYAYCRKQLKEYVAFGFEGPEMDPYTEGYHLIGKNVIFFRRDRYEMVSAGTYWLSDDPVIGGSIAWGTNRARHCNWVRVRDRRTGRELRLLDIHLDHKVQEAKVEQARLVVREAAQYAESFPQIICADFNSKKDEPQVRHFVDNGWHDAYDELHDGREFGYTAHAFLGPNRPPQPSLGRIDYILTRGTARALSCEVLTESRNGIYPSDHYFMVAEILVE